MWHVVALSGDRSMQILQSVCDLDTIASSPAGSRIVNSWAKHYGHEHIRVLQELEISWNIDCYIKGRVNDNNESR